MAAPGIKLGLDEASIVISSPSSSSLASETLDILYRVDECFGCPLERLKRLDGDDRTIVVGTKHLIDLELRRSLAQNGSAVVCQLDQLSLNSHAHYQINVRETLSNSSAAAASSVGGRRNFSCSLQTLDDGDCSYCPIALLLFVLVLITAVERIYSRFISRPRATRKQNNNNDNTNNGGAIVLNQDDSSSAAASTAADDGDDDDDGRSKQDDSSSADERLASGESTAAPRVEPMDVEGQPELNAAGASGAGPASSTHASSNSVEQGRQQAPPPSLQQQQQHSSAARIESLDAFRGLTIVGMIVVNYGGAGYRLLEHQPWDGLTLADLVFPFFIFSMGASIVLSTRSLMKRGKRLHEIFIKILRRASLLMLLGLCLNSKWLNTRTQGLDELRLTGVLQRFSVSYLVVASMYAIKQFMIRWIKAQSLYRVPLVSRLIGLVFEFLTGANYLVLYVYFTFFYEYSATCPAGYLGPGGMTENGIYANCTGGAAAWLDRLVLGEKHLYHGDDVKQLFHTTIGHDPEGLLGNTTSILLTLVGLQCGKILATTTTSTTIIAKPQANSFNSHKRRVYSLLKWILISSLLLGFSVIFVPINKRLWSVSFVSVSALAAFVCITILYMLLDVYNCQRTFLLRLLISAGKNSIFLYVGHSLLFGMLPWHFYVDESSHLQLLLRLTWSTLIWLLIAHYMASKRLFIRV